MKTIQRIRAMSGRNDTERAIAFMRQTDPVFARQPWSVQCGAAAQLLTAALAEDAPGTPPPATSAIAKLADALKAKSFTDALRAAFAEDPDTAHALVRAAVAAAEPPGATQPGDSGGLMSRVQRPRNATEAAIAHLTSRDPGRPRTIASPRSTVAPMRHSDRLWLAIHARLTLPTVTRALAGHACNRSVAERLTAAAAIVGVELPSLVVSKKGGYRGRRGKP